MKEGVQFFKLDRETNALIPDPKIRFYASSHIDVVANVCAEIKHGGMKGRGIIVLPFDLSG